MNSKLLANLVRIINEDRRSVEYVPAETVAEEVYLEIVAEYQPEPDVYGQTEDDDDSDEDEESFTCFCPEKDMGGTTFTGTCIVCAKLDRLRDAGCPSVHPPHPEKSAGNDAFPVIPSLLDRLQTMLNEE